MEFGGSLPWFNASSNAAWCLGYLLILEKLVTAVVQVPDARAKEFKASSKTPLAVSRHWHVAAMTLQVAKNWSPTKSFKAYHSFFILVKPFEMDEKNPILSTTKADGQDFTARGGSTLARQAQLRGAWGATGDPEKATGFPYEQLLFWRSPTFRT